MQLFNVVLALAAVAFAPAEATSDAASNSLAARIKDTARVMISTGNRDAAGVRGSCGCADGTGQWCENIWKTGGICCCPGSYCSDGSCYVGR